MGEPDSRPVRVLPFSLPLCLSYPFCNPSHHLPSPPLPSPHPSKTPSRPDFARNGPPPANPSLVNAAPEFYPQPGNPPQGWTYAGFLTIEAGPSGRGKNTIWWMGLANCFWWVDRQRGVAGFLGGQVSGLLDESGSCWVGLVLIMCRCCRMAIRRLFPRGLCVRRRFMIIWSEGVGRVDGPMSTFSSTPVSSVQPVYFSSPSTRPLPSPSPKKTPNLSTTPSASPNPSLPCCSTKSANP